MFYFIMESIHNLKYFLSIAIIILSIPISDNITKSLTAYFRRKNLDKYKNFFGNTVFILFIRLIIVTIGIVVAGMISGINMNYIFGGIGIVSLMLPITLQSPAQDFVCGLLIIALDKIRVNELIRIDELNIEGKVTNIHAFSTSIISPLSNAITDIPNHNLWSMNIQSITRSPRQKILLEVLLSNRNDIGIIETVIRKVLLTHPNVDDLEIAYTKQSERGLTLMIPVKVNSPKNDFLPTQNELNKHLKIGLQKYGIIFVDGATPVSLKHKSNTITPIIVNSITPV